MDQPAATPVRSGLLYFMGYFDRLLDSEFVEYAAAATFIFIWWFVSKTTHAIRRLKDGPREEITEPRPRRRIPLR